jgi:cytochrome c nitrite reductase small subunit
MGKNLMALGLRPGREDSTIRRMNIVHRVTSIVTLSGLPRPLQIGIYGLVGVAVGMALLLTRIANATSYLSDAPLTCINCHVMTDAYASWQRGSHGRVAVCVDCHVPHDNIAAKYAYKARDGMKHSYVFTMRKEPQVLELSARAVPVVQANCVHCHSHQLMMIRLAGTSERRCWDCHTNIHGEVRSLSASPIELRPDLPAAGLP